MTDSITRGINKLLSSNNMVHTTEIWKTVGKGKYYILDKYYSKKVF